jgi:hypothetical protein
VIAKSLSQSKLAGMIAGLRAMWIFFALVALSAVLGSFAPDVTHADLSKVEGIVINMQSGSRSAPRWTIRSASTEEIAVELGRDGWLPGKQQKQSTLIGEQVTVIIGAERSGTRKVYGLRANGEEFLDVDQAIKADNDFRHSLGLYGWPIFISMTLLSLVATILRRKGYPSY